MNDCKIYNVETFQIEKVEDKDKNKKVILKGNAMPLGEISRNGVFYRPESVKKAYKSLKGNSFLFAHQQNEVGHVLGHVINSGLTDSHVTYEVDIDPEEKDFIRKSERGDIKHVSVGAIINPETIKFNEDNGTAEVDVVEFAELSSAPVPGYKNTSASLNKNEAVIMLAETLGKKDIVEKLKQRNEAEEEPDEPKEEPKDEAKEEPKTEEKTETEEPKEEPKEDNIKTEEEDTDEREKTEEEKIKDINSRIEDLFSKYEELLNHISALESKLDAMVEESDDEESETEEEGEDEDTDEEESKTDVEVLDEAEKCLAEAYKKEEFDKVEVVDHTEKESKTKEKELLGKDKEGNKVKEIDLNEIIRNNRRY